MKSINMKIRKFWKLWKPQRNSTIPWIWKQRYLKIRERCEIYWGVISEVLLPCWFSENLVLTRLGILIKFDFENGFSCVGYSEFENRMVTSLWKVNLNAHKLMNTKKRTFSWNHEYENQEFLALDFWVEFLFIFYLVKPDKNNDNKTKELSLWNMRYP